MQENAGLVSRAGQAHDYMEKSQPGWPGSQLTGLRFFRVIMMQIFVADVQEISLHSPPEKMAGHVYLMV